MKQKTATQPRIITRTVQRLIATANELLHLAAELEQSDARETRPDPRLRRKAKKAAR
jgi:hypothetical protein